MCIANHPVLYDLHMQALEQSCVRVSAEAVKPERGAPQDDDRGYVLPGYAVLARGLVQALRGMGFSAQRA